MADNEITMHPFDPNSYSAASPYCAAMVERDGGGDQCGLPREHVVHSSLLIGPLERPMRNTLDDRLRAFEELLALPGGRIDDLNRRAARNIIIEARAALKEKS